MKAILAVLMISSLKVSSSTAQTIRTDGNVTGQVICYMIDAPDTFFVGSTEGIFRSSDKGGSWAAMSQRVTYVMSMTMSGARMLAGSHGGGIFMSTNSGESWEPVNNGLSKKNVLSLAVSGSNIVAGTRNGGIYLLENGKQNWTEMNDGIPPNADVYSLAEVGKTLYAGTQLGVFSSPADVVRWSKLP
jgi:photosystem II stability/assembly factor-like uncharacterized protein